MDLACPSVAQLLGGAAGGLGEVLDGDGLTHGE
jgi:hypothetical protein